MRLYKFIIAAALSTTVALTGCSSTIETREPSYFKPAMSASYIAVFTLTDTVSELRLSPLSASRVYAYSLMAGDIAYDTASGAQAEEASATAISYVSTKLFQNKLATDNMEFYRLRFTQTPSPLGIEVGRKVLQLAALDGFSDLDRVMQDSVSNSAKTDPLWQWEPTGLMRSPGFEPQWGTLNPIINLTKSCEAQTPDLELLYNEAESLLSLTDSLKAGKETELFLSGDGTPTPPGQWLRAVAQAGKAANLPSSELSSLIGKAAVASYDVSIVLWRDKYLYNIARPETMWKRLFNEDIVLTRETPPHPSYPSGHSGFSAAAAFVLQKNLGDVPVSFSLKEDMIAPAETHTYTTPSDAVTAASRSRVEPFFHYPSDVNAGEKLGYCVGEIVNDNYLQILDTITNY